MLLPDREKMTNPTAPVTTGAVRGVAATAQTVLSELAGRRLSPLPVTVRFWDGSELPSDGTAAVVVRDPSALAHLLRAPGQLGLARAWVDGSLDVDGEL